MRVPDEHVEPALKELAEPVQEKLDGASPVRYSQGWCVGPRGPDTRRRTGSDGTDGNSVSACSALVDLRNDT